MPRSSRPRSVRLAEKAIRDPEMGCLLWGGYLNHAGYGEIGNGPAGSGTTLTHIAAWQDAYGPVPPGLELDHKCFAPACMELTHLEPVTHEENMRRAKERRYTQRGGAKCPRGHVYDAWRWDKNRGKTYPRCMTCHRAYAKVG